MDPLESEIREDEVVVFYPTYGRLLEDGSAWSISIHGSIFEPEEGSFKRAATLGLLRRLLGLSREQTESAIFKRRARAFLVDNERGKAIAIRLGDNVYPAGTSAANGHFNTTLRLPVREIERLPAAARQEHGWLAFRAVTRADDARTFAGRAQLIGREGLSVISDLDDTIKVTQVASRKTLLANTFLREFEPVDGMPELYRQWAESGAVFHYVSGSPWQLYGPLAGFLEAEGFPAGSFHLKQLRLKDSSALEFFGSQEAYKSDVIEGILAEFPHRRFVLVGDSGEQDPEVYGEVARNQPQQVLRVFIRDVGGLGETADRFRQAFDGVPKARWKVFAKPEQLKGIVSGDLPGP